MTTLKTCLIVILVCQCGFTEPPNVRTASRLDDYLIVDGENVYGGTLGLFANDLNTATIDRDFVNATWPSPANKRTQKQLLSLLKEKDSRVGAYVALNALYPDQKLTIVQGITYLPDDSEKTTFTLAIRNGGTTSLFEVDWKTFAGVATAHWKQEFAKLNRVQSQLPHK